MIVMSPLHIPTPENPYISFELFDNRAILHIHRECNYGNPEIDTEESIYRRRLSNELKKLIEVNNYINEETYPTTIIKRLTFNLREVY